MARSRSDGEHDVHGLAARGRGDAVGPQDAHRRPAGHRSRSRRADSQACGRHSARAVHESGCTGCTADRRERHDHAGRLARSGPDRRAEDGHHRRAHGGGQMHRSGVHGQQEIQPGDHGRQRADVQPVQRDRARVRRKMRRDGVHHSAILCAAGEDQRRSTLLQYLSPRP